MEEGRTIDLAESLNGEWMAPQQMGYPAVPSAREAMKLATLEAHAQAAAAFIDALPKAVQIGRQEIQATGGTNTLYVYASPRRITIEQRTPFWRLLEGRIVIDLPEYFHPELPNG